MDHQHPIQLEYEGEQTARDPHLDLFCDVFTQYIGDLKAHQRWLVWPDASESEDGGAAWRDFRSPKRLQFNHLCNMTGIDSDAAHEAIKATIAAMCQGGMQ